MLGTPSLSSRCLPPKRQGEWRGLSPPRQPDPRRPGWGDAPRAVRPRHPRSLAAVPGYPSHPAATQSPDPAPCGPSLAVILPLTSSRSHSQPAPPSGPKLPARVSLSDLISGLGRRGGTGMIREGRATREDRRPSCTSALRCAHFRSAVGGATGN